MNKEMVIWWYGDKGTDSYLFEKNEIEEWYLGDDEGRLFMLQSNIGNVNLQNLSTAFNQFCNTNDWEDDEEHITDFLEQLGYGKVEVSSTPERFYKNIHAANTVLCDVDEKRFFYLNEIYNNKFGDFHSYYFFDGSNNEEICFELIGGSQTEVTCTTTSVSFNGDDDDVFKVYKLDLIDREKADDEYLLETISYKHYGPSSGEVATIDIIKNLLEEIELDVEYYIEKIGKL